MEAAPSSCLLLAHESSLTYPVLNPVSPEKAFESMWGGVSCLPGCFSMDRIKTSKGDYGYWVLILANLDIVCHYSGKVVDNLHNEIL